MYVKNSQWQSKLKLINAQMLVERVGTKTVINKYFNNEKRLLDQVEATQRMLTDQSEGRDFFKRLFGR